MLHERMLLTALGYDHALNESLKISIVQPIKLELAHCRENVSAEVTSSTGPSLRPGDVNVLVPKVCPLRDGRDAGREITARV